MRAMMIAAALTITSVGIAQADNGAFENREKLKQIFQEQRAKKETAQVSSGRETGLLGRIFGSFSLGVADSSSIEVGSDFRRFGTAGRDR